MPGEQRLAESAWQTIARTPLSPTSSWWRDWTESLFQGTLFPIGPSGTWGCAKWAGRNGSDMAFPGCWQCSRAAVLPLAYLWTETEVLLGVWYSSETPGFNKGEGKTLYHDNYGNKEWKLYDKTGPDWMQIVLSYVLAKLIAVLSVSVSDFPKHTATYHDIAQLQDRGKNWQMLLLVI